MSPMAVGSIGSPKTREGQWSCSAGSKGKNGLSPQGQEGQLDQIVQFCDMFRKPLSEGRRKTNTNREAWWESFIIQRSHMHGESKQVQQLLGDPA